MVKTWWRAIWMDDFHTNKGEGSEASTKGVEARLGQ